MFFSSPSVRHLQALAKIIRVLVAILVVASTIDSKITFADEVDFNRVIRPILSNNCFFCHGPDRETREADLRLDIREDAIEAFAFVPGDPNESELVYRIFSEDSDEVMPPPKSNHSLSDKEKELLQRWIAEGAEYENHWAYTPIESPPFESIDEIVTRRLEKKGLKLSPEASKATLLRRLSFDLNGLPPKPEAVQTFVNETDPDAYEKAVDDLLTSKHYGEKMAIHWLDAVRKNDGLLSTPACQNCRGSESRTWDAPCVHRDSYETSARIVPSIGSGR
tara:strand:+ start:729 stop:1562 length:834 start_codon:yes stop_codon:yes gene_type:complete